MPPLLLTIKTLKLASSSHLLLLFCASGWSKILSWGVKPCYQLIDNDSSNMVIPQSKRAKKIILNFSEVVLNYSLCSLKAKVKPSWSDFFAAYSRMVCPPLLFISSRPLGKKQKFHLHGAYFFAPRTLYFRVIPGPGLCSLVAIKTTILQNPAAPLLNDLPYANKIIS